MARNNGRDGIPRIGRPDGPSTPHAGDLYADMGADSAPVDIAAVRRDDEFIDAIRSDGPIATDNADEYQLALLLATWRAEVTAPALPAGPDLEVVAAAVEQEIAAVGLSRRAKTRTRGAFLRPIAGAAAAIAVVMGGLVVFSYNSAPGDPLWSVKSVVFAQQADSTVAQIDTTSQLEQAEQLLAAGDVEGARSLLDGASSTTGSVIDQAQRSDLEMWLQRLVEQMQALIPPPPVLVPTVVDPTVPLPEVIQPAIPPEVLSTTVLPLPPVVTTPVEVPPPVVTDLPVPQETTVPPVTETSDSGPTVVGEPSQPTTASASGSTGQDFSSPGAETLNGG